MSNVADDQVEGKPGWFARLRQGLAKTRDGLSSRLDQMFAGERPSTKPCWMR